MSAGIRGISTARSLATAIVLVAVAVVGWTVTRDGRATIPQSVAAATVAALRHPRSVPPAYAIDLIAEMPGGANIATPGQNHSAVTLQRDRALSIAGWAFDPVAREPARAIFLKVDGRALLLASYGERRPDVAQFYHTPAVASTGFSALVPAGLLGAGTHRIDIVVLTADGAGYYQIDDRIRLRQAS